MVTEQALALRCRSLTKRYGSVLALDGLDIDLPHGQVLALLGSSGCGKTTALRVIAGFETPEQGTVEINGRTVTGPQAHLPPERRHIGLVFQDYALFPHMSVAKNIAFGLPKDSRKQRLQELMELVGLEGLDRRMPHELSGGQQQRVALARTLATEPSVLLLDEPFSNLDARLRVQVRDEVRRIIRETGTTAVFVTHDQEEAFVMADQIIVMQSGRCEQTGTAMELYLQPETRHVAGFVGLANFVPARLSGATVTCDLGSFTATRPLKGDIEVMLRPEDVALGEGATEVEVVKREFHGPFWYFTVRLPSGHTLIARRAAAAPLDVGDRVSAGLRIESPVVFEVQAKDEQAPV